MTALKLSQITDRDAVGFLASLDRHDVKLRDLAGDFGERIGRDRLFARVLEAFSKRNPQGDTFDNLVFFAGVGWLMRHLVEARIDAEPPSGVVRLAVVEENCPTCGRAR